MGFGTSIHIICVLLAVYVCLIAARVFLSWLRPQPGNSIFPYIGHYSG